MRAAGVVPVDLGRLTAERQTAYLQLCHGGHSVAQQEQACSYLADALNLPDHRHDARSSVAVDFAAWLLTACDQLHLDSSQTSAVLGIGQQLLESCAAGASRGEAQDQLRGALLQLCSPCRPQAATAETAEPPHAVAAAAAAAAPAEAAAEAAAAAGPTGHTTPAGSSGHGITVCLSPAAIAGLAAALTSTLLQHYRLWSYLLLHEQQHVQHAHHLMVETPGAPPPLQQALAEADWAAHLAAEQAAQEAAQAAAAAAEQAARAAEQAALLAQAAAAEAAARAEQLQRKPKTLDEAVDKLVALRLEEVGQGLAGEFAAKAAALTARLSHLEAQAVLQQQLQSSSGAKGASSRVASAKPVAAAAAAAAGAT